MDSKSYGDLAVKTSAVEELSLPNLYLVISYFDLFNAFTAKNNHFSGVNFISINQPV